MAKKTPLHRRSDVPYMEKYNYITRMTDLLTGVAERTEVSLKFMLSQTALETEYGTHILGNNLFGMTTIPGDGWTGGKIKVDDKWFRTYSSWEECVKDYEKWLHKPRYNRILDADIRNDVMKCGLVLQKGKWEGENYANKIFEVSKSWTMKQALRQYEPGLNYQWKEPEQYAPGVAPEESGPDFGDWREGHVAESD